VITGERTLIGALVLGVGLALGGWFVGHGFAVGRGTDRFVTVKGVSEREVEADLALWPLRVVSTDNDLGRAQARIDQDVGRILEFLAEQGIDTSLAERQNLQVTDVLANPYREGTATNRFIVTQTVMVRSDEPELVLTASQRVGALVEAGVVLTSGQDYGPGGPTFVFSRLNDLKPEMIAEATASAREAAEQFALDSRSSLGGIRRANQGVFVILPRDQAPGIFEQSQVHKTVRVVSTIEYFLKD
jgi:hypothetical protein